MKEDTQPETMNIISEQKYVRDFLSRVDDYLGTKAQAHDKSRRYAYPSGYWTLEVFHQGMTLIPEEQVRCDIEPQLESQMLTTIGSGSIYWPGRSTWKKLTVGYTALGDSVGGMLISDWEELAMVHHATAELTYWLGVDNPDRTWNLKNWTVVNLSTSPTQSAMIGVDLAFMFSEASLTRY